MPPFNQVAYRFRNDNGNETTATWRQNQNTVDTVAVDTNFRVRFEIQNGASVGNNKVWQLQYNRNSLGWNPVNASSSVVRTVASPNLADAANLTNQLTVGTGTFQGATGFDEGNGAAGGNSMDVVANGHAEAEYSIQIRGVDVTNGDTIGLRVTDAGTALPTYTVNATLTAVKDAIGNIGITDIPDLAALTGSVDIAGDIAATDELDTASGNGTLRRNIGKVTQLNAALWPGRRYTSFFHIQASTGDFALTDTADEIATAWAGTVESLTSFALTEAPDVADFSGVVITQGDLSATDTNDTLAAIGVATSGADLVATDPVDVFDISGTVGVVPSKKTQLNAALWPSRRYADFARIQQAILDATDAPDVAAVDATVYSVATLAAIDTRDILAATSISRGRFIQLNAALWPSRRYGNFSLKSNAGIVAAVETQDVAAITGNIPTNVIGLIAATDPQTFIGLVDENGNHIIDGSGNWIGADYCADTAAADGTVGDIVFIAGDLAATDAIDTAAASAKIVGTGTMAATDATDSLSSTGILGAALGDLAATDPVDTFVSTAISQWFATFAATEPTDQASATATVEWLNNVLVATEAPDVLAADGSVLVEGYMDAEEDEDICRIGLQPSLNLFVDCYETTDPKNNIVPIYVVADLGIGVVPVHFTSEGYNVVPVAKQAQPGENIVDVCEVQ